MFAVYILYSKTLDKYYIGQTFDLSNRIQQHIQNQNLGASDWILKYKEELPSRSAACFRETQLKKKKSRKYLEFLISAATLN